MLQQRTSTKSIAKILLILISHIPALQSRPTKGLEALDHHHDGFPEEDPASPAFWWKLGIGLILVLLGGVFAGITTFIVFANSGLTLALLSQDEITVRIQISGVDE
jgi:hypothetical protein